MELIIYTIGKERLNLLTYYSFKFHILPGCSKWCVKQINNICILEKGSSNEYSNIIFITLFYISGTVKLFIFIVYLPLIKLRIKFLYVFEEKKTIIGTLSEMDVFNSITWLLCAAWICSRYMKKKMCQMTLFFKIYDVQTSLI